MYVFLVTIFLTTTGFDIGSEKYMGHLAGSWTACEQLARQFSFTHTTPDGYQGIAFYCEERPAGPGSAEGPGR